MKGKLLLSFTKFHWILPVFFVIAGMNDRLVDPDIDMLVKLLTFQTGRFGVVAEMSSVPSVEPGWLFDIGGYTTQVFGQVPKMQVLNFVRQFGGWVVLYFKPYIQLI